MMRWKGNRRQNDGDKIERERVTENRSEAGKTNGREGGGCTMMAMSPRSGRWLKNEVIW